MTKTSDAVEGECIHDFGWGNVGVSCRKCGKSKEEIWKQRYNDAKETILTLQKEKEALQAKIDSLMLEYCPDEMTEEQFENWGKRQVPVKDPTHD
jgi:hypothetical protein